MIKDWKLIKNQPASKKWITAEYSNTSKKPHKTILVYEEDEEYKDDYGNYRIYIGNTVGKKEEGNYYSAKSKSLALKKAKELMKNN